MLAPSSDRSNQIALQYRTDFILENTSDGLTVSEITDKSDLNSLKCQIANGQNLEVRMTVGDVLTNARAAFQVNGQVQEYAAELTNVDSYVEYISKLPSGSKYITIRFTVRDLKNGSLVDVDCQLRGPGAPLVKGE